jgi:putative tryptophan/tyrosine transport system substrate-binding protein
MRRRDVIALLTSGSIWSRAVGARVNAKPRRIGFLTSASPPASIEASYLSGFTQGMRELGYVEGHDFVVEWRFADGRLERFADFAAELVRLRVDVLVTGTPTAVPPVRDVTNTIPIVMGYSTDPVGNGFIASLSRPGGNITGLASSQEDAAPKQLELLSMTIPTLSRVGLLVDSSSPNSHSVVQNAQAAAEQVGVVLIPSEARSVQEIESAFAMLSSQRVAAVMVVTGSVTFFNRERIAELALKNRLASMFSLREFVAAGGLMSYGESLFDFFRRSAAYVVKIFRGAQPADLPVEQPTRLILAVNRNTAQAIGVTIPPSLLALADEVIE